MHKHIFAFFGLTLLLGSVGFFHLALASDAGLLTRGYTLNTGHLAQGDIPLPPGGDPPGGGGGGGGDPPGGGGGTNTDGGGFSNPLAYNTIWDFLQALLKAVVLIVFPLIVLMLVYTGFLFVTAQGNDAKLTTARKTFFYTLLGGLIVLGAQALSLAIQATVQEIQGGNVEATPPDRFV